MRTLARFGIGLLCFFGGYQAVAIFLIGPHVRLTAPGPSCAKEGAVDRADAVDPLAAASSSPGPGLALDRDLCFLAPVESLGDRVAVQFTRARESAGGSLVVRRVLRSPAVARAARAAREVQRRAGQRPEPLYVALTGHGGPSFVGVQPFFIHEGAPAPRLATGPLVFLSQSEIAGLSGDAPRRALAVLCHEIGHVMMVWTHGLGAYPLGAEEYLDQAFGSRGHWLGKCTNREYAFSEGWAEFVALWATGGAATSRYFLEDEGEGAAGAGVAGGAALLPKARIAAREGAVCHLLLALADDLGREAALPLYVGTLLRHRPREADEFFRGLARDQPDAAFARDLRRTLLAFSGGAWDIREDIPAETAFLRRVMRRATAFGR